MITPPNPWLDRARECSDDYIRTQASIATDNGPYSLLSDDFCTACELVRQERMLLPLHSWSVQRLEWRRLALEELRAAV